MPVEIPMTRGYVALVDPEDVDLVCGRKWRASGPDNGAIYAATNVGTDTTVYMHRLLFGLSRGDRRWVVDHRDGNGLNNQRSNLRKTTQSQNCAHHPRATVGATNKHGFRGLVCIQGRYYGRVTRAEVQLYTQGYDTPEAAARARDQLTLKHYGEFATLNFPDLRSAA